MVMFSWIYFQESLLRVSPLLPCLRGPLQRSPLPRSLSMPCTLGALGLGSFYPMCKSSHSNLHWAGRDTLGLAPASEPLSAQSSPVTAFGLVLPSKTITPALSPLNLTQALPLTNLRIPTSILASASQRSWTGTETDEVLLKAGNKKVKKKENHVSPEQKCGLVVKSPHALSSTPVFQPPCHNYTH